MDRFGPFLLQRLALTLNHLERVLQKADLGH